MRTEILLGQAAGRHDGDLKRQGWVVEGSDRVGVRVRARVRVRKLRRCWCGRVLRPGSYYIYIYIYIYIYTYIPGRLR